MWKLLNDFTLVNEDDPHDLMVVQQTIVIRRIKVPHTCDIIEQGFCNLSAAKKALLSYVGTSPAETTIAAMFK